MGKIKNPLQFSTYFKIAESVLEKLGVLNPTLNVDAKLFIDPLLLPLSKHSEINRGAESYKQFFTEIIKLLSASQKEGDVAWRAAYRKLQFKEIKGTCLGYGAASIRGSGLGPTLAYKITRTAKEIIDLGVTDPDLFLTLPLLEEKIGPDLISDMVTNIIITDLVAFNERVLSKMGLPMETFRFKDVYVKLPRNPKESNRTAVILVPIDILRDLPIANDWDEVCDNAAGIAELRDRVNRQVGEIWAAKTRKDKEKIRESVLSNRNGVLTLLEMLHATKPKHYDFSKDPHGIFVWRLVHEAVAKEHPLTLEQPKHTLDDAYNLVMRIVDQFQHLVEKRGLARELWHDGKRRGEKSVQRLFFAVADSYCQANDLDISPEVDTGTGEIDFKFSKGYSIRILVEVKLSDNSKVVAGYEKQLESYKNAEKTTKGIYIVIDVGSMGTKDERLYDVKNKMREKGYPVSEIVIIDGNIQMSASKL